MDGLNRLVHRLIEPPAPGFALRATTRQDAQDAKDAKLMMKKDKYLVETGLKGQTELDQLFTALPFGHFLTQQSA